MVPSMIVSSRKEIGGHLPHCCCTNSQQVHRGLLAGGKNTQEKYMEGGVYYYYYDYFFCEKHKIGLILAHRVCGFLNMQLPIKVKLKLIY
jgi:hypothetical protein